MARRDWLAFSILCLIVLLTSVVPVRAESARAASAAASASGHEDPLADPWLSEQGPAVPATVEVPRELVVAAWTSAPDSPHARAAALHRIHLEAGLGDLTAPAHVLLASATEEDPDVYSGYARDLAPGLPAIQIAHARALWHVGDIGAAVGAMVHALWAIAFSLAAQLWLLENVTLMLLVVVLVASLAFIFLASLQVFPHAAHDLGDRLSSQMPGFARSGALAALLLSPLLLGEGVIGVALALFALAFFYGKSYQRSVLVMAAVLLVIGLHPLAQFTSVATTLVEQDPVVPSVLAVVAGSETRADVERLEAAFEEDRAAAHALAYRARRHGLVDLSRELLDSMNERDPSDAVVLGNRGNIEMRRGETELAIDYYERAATLIDSPTLLFDLSQAYASDFRMEDYELTLSRAQRVGDREVAALSGFGDAALVADLAYPMNLVRDRLATLALHTKPKLTLAEALAPGRLGERWFITASAFALVALLGLLFADRFDRASLCVRCGHRICTRCEETVWSEEICEDCHHLFQNPEATDPSLRMARLQALSQREVKIDRIVLTLSILFPGVAGFAARRPDLAMFSLLLFAWTATWVAWPSGIFDDPMMMGSVAVVAFAILGMLALIAYTGILIASLIVRKNL